ncbi:hypothetical protein GALMADRAFT_719218 [Galerina marginata CBS 339.88]|uniref:Nephrocystin 3-like N-terminal domain-containing protein n=1 Tax=Galerina marginata (strain CBS 339.88) TaxID=685588 RepID=A0A067TQK6_GALM3|nr:hypothetical protein GALMADRAFT_719218 [Galerina marginata CBS 339.88]
MSLSRNHLERGGLFGGVRDVVITGGTFIETHGVPNSVQESGLFMLNQAISHGAVHDSAERYPPGKCHPGTREEVLRLILEWINDPAPEADVLWLYGPAGAGKSAIMQTIAEILRELYQERYAGSFFFARGVPKRDQGSYLFSTLAYQIAINLAGAREAVNLSMVADPSLPTKSMNIQMHSLIVAPLMRSQYHQTHTATVIIDGLDECDGPNMQKAILSLIADTKSKSTLPLRFLIASRPEFWIRNCFDRQPLFNMTRRINLSESRDALEDIKKYLRDGFSDIYDNNLDIMTGVENPWPPSTVIDRLAQQASDQFIYASTVLKFFGASSQFNNPVSQLEILLGAGPLTSSAFSDLDQLYTQILVLYPRTEIMTRFLGGIVTLRCSIPEAIACLLDIGGDELPLLLRATRSLIEIFSPDNEFEVDDEDLHMIYEGKTYIQFYHLSMRDFLTDSNRSGQFYVNLQEIHDLMFSRYLNLTICALRGAPSYNSIFGAEATCSNWWHAPLYLTKGPSTAVIRSAVGDLHQAIGYFRFGQSMSERQAMVHPGVLLGQLANAKEQVGYIQYNDSRAE